MNSNIIIHLGVECIEYMQLYVCIYLTCGHKSSVVSVKISVATLHANSMVLNTKLEKIVGILLRMCMFHYTSITLVS